MTTLNKWLHTDKGSSSVMGGAPNVSTLQQSRQTNSFIATPTTPASNDNVVATTQDGTKTTIVIAMQQQHQKKMPW